MSDEPRYVIPISCWRPRHGTGIPADAEMYPPRCPDPDWCRGNRQCYWECNKSLSYDGLDDETDHHRS